ncbi:bifunctional monodehydroascorbate reductase and carbonic anhydrase nectarin-3 [Selaginella moellendorffii]|uniref:bifunctional monodehydroascorbate reductase and carbonic anhydrase nectarin-3 n=1 Tax=Selaginella moellendorffii TaxID=88036 RepID=UPI000D1C536B|nr:bifunctional monodehydroascorbate reductase and carbonic anhydrase nectarin-3 [Selaginella moellendorffii]|eukprot:XP_024531046.1 bifunctional monodehydroascorbate reductase and carbonic anhydrase nectarin-3 [Selaginella moellendorffii]
MERTNLILLLFVFAQAMIIAQADEEYDYSNGTRGQANWGNLRQEWRACSSGRMQSPVDIQSKELQPVCSLKLLQTRYKPTNATLTNLDHDIALEFGDASSGSLIIDGTLYSVSEYHIHAPSEHTVNGKHLAVEGHLVHRSEDNRLAVVAVMYTIGSEDDPFIDQVEHFLPELSGEQDVQVVDPSLLNVGGKRFFRYVGSLTSPPCTEQVTWSVLRRPRTISKTQYRLLVNALNGDNNRSIQGLFGRRISYYK